MNDDPWIIVPNWKKFQHYTDRQPLWIKVYTELNSRDDFLGLYDSSAGLLLRIWIEFARAEGQLRLSTVPAGVRQKNRRRALERLKDAGLIQLSDSKPPRHTDRTPLALARARARSREKKYLRTSSEERASARAQKSGSRTHADRDEFASPAPSTSNDRRPQKVGAYEAAEAMTRNVGWEYPLEVYRDELRRFDLTILERDLLETLWARLVDDDEALEW
jgi:hypothetical protein